MIGMRHIHVIHGMLFHPMFCMHLVLIVRARLWGMVMFGIWHVLQPFLRAIRLTFRPCDTPWYYRRSLTSAASAAVWRLGQQASSLKRRVDLLCARTGRILAAGHHARIGPDKVQPLAGLQIGRHFQR